MIYVMRPTVKLQVQVFKVVDHTKEELVQVHPVEVAAPVVYFCFEQA